MAHETIEHSTWDINRRRFLQAVGAAGLSTGFAQTATAKQTPRYCAGELTTDTFGPASLTVQSAVSQLTGSPTDGTSYMVTRNQSPARLGRLNMDAREITGVFDVPSGSISYAAASLNNGRDLYTGMYPNASLYHFDTETEAFSLAASFSYDSFIMDLASVETTLSTGATERKVYLGSYPSGKVYEYNHKTGAIRDYGPAKSGELYVRSIEATPETIYAGTGTSNPDLVAIDRATGAKEFLLPQEVSENVSFVYDIAVSEKKVAAVTTSPAYLVVLDRADPSQYQIVSMTDEERNLMTVTINNDNVYFTGHGGKLYRYEMASNTVTHVATPVPGDAPVDDLTVRDNIIYGTGLSGTIWTYDIATQTIQYTDIHEAGMPPAPERPQSISSRGSKVFVGGAWQTTLFDVTDGSRKRRRTHGEPKEMTIVGDELYQAIYPRALIAKHNLNDDSEELAKVVGRIGHEQYRTRDIYFDDHTGYLFVGTRAAYGKQGGALTTFDPETEEIVGVDRNIVQNHTIATVTAHAGTAYLGTTTANGIGAESGDGPARLIGWDPIDREKLWEMQPVNEDWIRYLVTTETANGSPRVCGITRNGTLFVVDPTERSVVHSQDVGGVGELIVPEWDDRIYGVDSQHLYRFDLATKEVETLVTGLGAEWWNEPQLSADQERNLYTLTGRDLLQVTVPPEKNQGANFTVSGSRSDDGSVFTAGQTNEINITVQPTQNAAVRDVAPADWRIKESDDVDRVETANNVKYVYFKNPAQADKKTSYTYFAEAPAELTNSGVAEWQEVEVRPKKGPCKDGWIVISGTSDNNIVAGVDTTIV